MSGYEIETPQLSVNAVSYMRIPVVASTGAAGVIVAQAVRDGGSRDWRIDYLAFELTHAPTHKVTSPPAKAIDGSNSSSVAVVAPFYGRRVTPVDTTMLLDAPPKPLRVHCFNANDGVKRAPFVLFDHRQPSELLSCEAPSK